ncbi:MAG TPA: SUMF1/EgtB/PvdO family nonheme iron enzyme [Anaerolineales bacterium]|nr:SUMF1/EgtB/PvdO family nonheme iron enzyme [Anaerolineales bacterium]
MKKVLHRTAFVVLAVTFLLGACVPTPTPAPLPTSTSLPATPLPATEPPTATATATLVPIPLAGVQAGTTMKWIDTSVLSYIPQGEFAMGAGTSDTPTHTVALDGFWIQQTSVTNGMYAQCVATGQCTPPTQELGTPNYTIADYNSYPVVGVTWDQANTYCSWIQGSLPTEAQWEYAARGNTSSTYPWGNDGAACDYLNFGGCIGHTTDVTEYTSGRTPFGLFDMAGNVFEWVKDWYDPAYYNNSPSQNPTGPDSGTQRVIRGSSFETDTDQAASSLRHFASPTYHSRDLGFRCVVTQPKPLAPFCQLGAYIPSVSSLTQGQQCQLPDAVIRGQYCSGGDSFVTLNISEGAVYQLNRKDYDCTEAIVDGKRLLTCKGPKYTETTADITVCNAACSNAASQTTQTPVCDPGYTLDANTGECVYSPISSDVSVAGCPVGYKLIDQGGQKSCALAPGVDGSCPTGLYFDTQYNACVPPSGIAQAPYGINNPGLAAQTFQGCAAGYQYDSTNQCCQASTNTAYPACPAGTTYDSTLKACEPSQIRLSGTGCVTVSATTLKCSQPVDICSKITIEAVCRRNAYACDWNDKTGVCQLKK